jgi:hypothetical protein
LACQQVNKSGRAKKPRLFDSSMSMARLAAYKDGIAGIDERIMTAAERWLERLDKAPE